MHSISLLHPRLGLFIRYLSMHLLTSSMVDAISDSVHADMYICLKSYVHAHVQVILGLYYVGISCLVTMAVL